MCSSDLLHAIAAVFTGIKPAVMVVVILAAHRLGRRALKKPWMVLLALASFLGLVFGPIDFPLIVLGAGLIGWGVSRWRPEWIVASSGGHAPAMAHHREDDSKPLRPFVFDDETPLPEHARFKSGQMFKVLVIGILCIVVPMAALV